MPEIIEYILDSLALCIVYLVKALLGSLKFYPNIYLCQHRALEISEIQNLRVPLLPWVHQLIFNLFIKHLMTFLFVQHLLKHTQN